MGGHVRKAQGIVEEGHRSTAKLSRPEILRKERGVRYGTLAAKGTHGEEQRAVVNLWSHLEEPSNLGNQENNTLVTFLSPSSF